MSGSSGSMIGSLRRASQASLVLKRAFSASVLPGLTSLIAASYRWSVSAASRSTHRQIGAVQDVGIAHQLVRLARKADAAALHHIGVMGELQRDMGELLDQQHADALGSEMLQHRGPPGADDRRKAEGE